MTDIPAAEARKGIQIAIDELRKPGALVTKAPLLAGTSGLLSAFWVAVIMISPKVLPGPRALGLAATAAVGLMTSLAAMVVTIGDSKAHKPFCAFLDKVQDDLADMKSVTDLDTLKAKASSNFNEAVQEAGKWGWGIGITKGCRKALEMRNTALIAAFADARRTLAVARPEQPAGTPDSKICPATG